MTVQRKRPDYVGDGIGQHVVPMFALVLRLFGFAPALLAFEVGQCEGDVGRYLGQLGDLACRQQLGRPGVDIQGADDVII